MSLGKHRLHQSAALLFSAIAVVLSGCDGSSSSKSSPQLADAEKRSMCHKALRGDGMHDAALSLASIGDATSVPFLIEALARFRLVADNPLETECTQMHCVDALRTITNQDAGLNHSEWAAWWEVNKQKPREEWVADGFKRRGLPVVTPPDAAYVHALVSEMADESVYHAKNAWRILESVSSELLQSQVDACSQSGDPAVRLGAIVVLSRIKSDVAGVRLGEMTIDPDAKVRECALTKFNEYSREHPILAPADQVIWKGSLGKEVTVVGAGPDEEHMFVGYEAAPKMGDDSYLACFNLRSKVPEWSCSVSDSVYSVPVVEKDRVFFCCNDGAVYCVAVATGDLLWRKTTEGTPHTRPRNKVILADGAAITTMTSYLYAFDQETGEIRWRLKESPVFGDLEYMDGHIYAASEKNLLLRIAPNGTVLFRKKADKPRLFGARDGVLYATIGEYSPTLVALSGENLDELWRRDFEDSDVNFAQSDACLVVGLRNTGYFGIEPATGRILWSAQGASCSPDAVFGNQFVANGGRFQIELRDTRSGKVSMHYDKPKIFSEHPVYMTRDIIVTGALVGSDDQDRDNLWILRVPPSLSF